MFGESERGIEGEAGIRREKEGGGERGRNRTGDTERW